jgi:hypothetical protein
MRRFIAFILLVAVLAVGGGIIASTAYQAGLGTAITTATGSGGVVVTPIVVPGYGYGPNPFGVGFGFFGFLATLFFLFIVFGLARAVFSRAGAGRQGGWGGPGWHGGPGPGVWGGPGGTGSDGGGRAPWETRARATFDEWHGQAHAGPPDSTAPADPA